MLACKYFRSFIGQYLKGFPIGSAAKVELMKAANYDELARLLARFPGDIAYPVRVENKPRGRSRGTAKVFLPQGWLD
jgi:hypothetical protein